jgi:predicted CoA-binding protein
MIGYITGMNDLISSFLLNKKIGVVGSFRDEEKYAYVIFKELVKQGYEPIPVTRGRGEVDRVTSYASILDLPPEVLAVDVVTSPEATSTVLEECSEKGIRYVWLQPGSESEDAVEFCKRNGINVIYDACILTSLSEQ